ncbi:hypothetical protein F5883DRAFT_544077 [Diaporthe sp. PMI_573]|nr:hypothetical protein F5883DRAFT_544077 [Diaporthaceae sp. PMI_573]
MSSVAFYDISIGYYAKAMTVLLGILKTASAHPDVASFLDARLAPDMYPLASQVRIATKPPVALVEALAGKELVAWWDEKLVGDRDDSPFVSVWGERERSWPELIARVEKTLEMLKDVDAKKANAEADEKTLPLQIAPESLGAAAFRSIPAVDFTLANGLPNVFFHVFMTYAILRSKGIDVGKKDVLIPFLPEYILEELFGKQAA